MAEAFQQEERITASHANLIAHGYRRTAQKEAFAQCWRQGLARQRAASAPCRKYLSAWIGEQRLSTARRWGTLRPRGQHPQSRRRCLLQLPAPQRIQQVTFFADVAGDQCFDANCYHAKLTEHVNREVAARPELVQIETAHRNPKERRPGTLSRNEYTEIPNTEDENEDSEPVMPCESSKTAIVVYGEGAGSTRIVCTDPDCLVHHPHRVIPIDPDAEARQREHEKEQARRKRLLKRRAESFNRILENAPATFRTAPHSFAALLRALVHTSTPISIHRRCSCVTASWPELTKTTSRRQKKC